MKKLILSLASLAFAGAANAADVSTCVGFNQTDSETPSADYASYSEEGEILSTLTFAEGEGSEAVINVFGTPAGPGFELLEFNAAEDTAVYVMGMISNDGLVPQGISENVSVTCDATTATVDVENGVLVYTFTQVEDSKISVSVVSEGETYELGTFEKVEETTAN